VDHKKNANTVSKNFDSSAIDNDGIVRIASRFLESKSKTAPTSTPVVVKQASETKDDQPTRIKVASVADVPSNFQSAGTGFWRSAHYLWEMISDDDGMFLVRKEEHKKVSQNRTASVQKVSDRFGNPLKVGSRVKFPNNGKVATGDIIVLAPSAISVQTDSGVEELPPDMLELMMEPELSAPKEMDPEMTLEAPMGNGLDLEACDSGPMIQACEEFEPEVTTSRLEDQVEVPEWDDMHEGTTDDHLKMMTALRKHNGRMVVASHNDTRFWQVSEISPDRFTVRTIDGGKLGLEGVRSLDSGFISRVGSWRVFDGTVKQAQTALQNSQINDWEEFWYAEGQRDAGKKTLTPQQKMDRKMKRKTKNLTSLPKPTIPKVSQMEQDKLQEKLALFQQMLQELQDILQDATMQNNDEALRSEVSTTLENTSKALEDLEKKPEGEHQPELGAKPELESMPS